MNKTLTSILTVTAFSILLIAITLFFGGLGLGRLFRLHGGMEYDFSGLLLVMDMLTIRKVYQLYFCQPKIILLWVSVECSSVLLWVFFIYFYKNILALQITHHLLQMVGLDGFAGDERGLNILAVLCGIIYPLLAAGCFFLG